MPPMRAPTSCATGFVTNNSGGKLDRAGVDGNAILFDKQQLLLVGHRDNDGGASGIDAGRVFPLPFPDQGQKLAGI